MTGIPKVRVGAVAYLNTRPLVLGLEQGLGAERIELSYAVPADLAERMAAGELDIALLPVIELARIPDLEIVPGLGIVTQGASRSVLLISREPLDRVETVALDAESRTSNALTRVMFGEFWGGRPEFVDPGRVRSDLKTALDGCDAAVRIGDKALVEPIPEGLHVCDLGKAWTEATGLPFVFAAWIARRGALDRETYRVLHESHRIGCRAIDMIAEDYAFEGQDGNRHPELARRYLNRNIRYRLGSPELKAVGMFLGLAARHGIIDRAPEIRMALGTPAGCATAAAEIRRPTA